MNIAEFANAELGILAVVTKSDDGVYKVVASDSDANAIIEVRFGFASEAAAIAYAEKFVADVVPAGTFF